MNWISCREDLPKKPGKYFCCVTAKGFACDDCLIYKTYLVCNYSTVYKKWFNDFDCDTNVNEVLAWMSIPEYTGS